MSDKYWWNRANYRFVKGLIKRCIATNNMEGGRYIDIGCSGGILTDCLSGYGRVVGIDISLNALKICKNKSITVAQGDAEYLPFKIGTFSMATSFDVIEHVDNDKKFLKEVNNILKPGGVLIMTVPAYMFLWGSHDIFYGHKRRYTKNGLVNLARGSGFRIDRISYKNACILPAMAIWRHLDRAKKANYGKRDDFVNFGYLAESALFWIFMFEMWLLKYINFPFGTSLFCEMKKEK